MLSFNIPEDNSVQLNRGRQTPISIVEAIEILTTRNSSTTNKIPFRPKGGEVYLFQPSSPSARNDWKADGHRWHNQGTTKLPRSRPCVAKSYFYIKTDSGTNQTFKKDVFILIQPDVYKGYSG